MTKVSVATVWLDGCSGCHMSLIDMDERLIELADRIDVVYSPLVDRKDYPEWVDVALVEGAASSAEDFEKIKKIRAHTGILVALGDCAVAANVPAMRNPFKVDDVMARGYFETAAIQKQVPREWCPPCCRSSARSTKWSRSMSSCRAARRPPIRFIRDHRAAGRARAGPHRPHAARGLGGCRMTQQIIIDPITRIEGHSKITIQLDENGRVEDARFHVTQYRGFEKFIEGRPYYEMPGLMGRICGICTISHEMASAKACDQIMAVRIPETARKLRRIVNLASILQSHALSFFYLSSPDFLLGLESDPARRNIFGLAQSHPQVARDGVRLRQFGQQIIEWMAGKRLHPTWVVPGGVRSPLLPEVRLRILSELPEIYSIIHTTSTGSRRSLDDYADEIRTFGTSRRYSWGW